MIYLRGTQTINVVEREVGRAVITSVLLGCCGLVTAGTIAVTAVHDGSAGWPVYLSFLCAGPVGIWLSIIGRRRDE
jgi:hypothetical protein